MRAADARVPSRRLEELDDLPELFLSLVDAGDVDELHLDVVLGVNLGAAAREGHHAAFGPAHAAEEEAPQCDEKDERNDPAEYLPNPPIGDLAGVLHAVLLEILEQLWIFDANGREGRPLAALRLHPALDPLLADGDFLHLAVADARLELAVRDRIADLHRVDEHVPDCEQQQEAERVPHRRARRRTRRQAAATRIGRFRGGLFSHLV